ncbi:SGNH/GDSL hydrolase family protein [Actinacidiphila bryophytorum]|uniref:Lipase 1 n=1 Tax=Actinacidiphila bryophytorum TaxID=1436133 RepID=A0A9W4EC08_9ACTN|nr:SGNH/GDSL hydrolase family protein [Actinacidiphila bryophytorum]MBM9436655.1 SGNH/GDSL hydrolase family protein [Actinacidiphila bryophytorum]MBN6546462.1 SGNH/GDSL hydrolase family protein [Actinacidiphila bryophytorum]CAG7598619.1 Lipase 1 [Actinacidiphila bryophytorum]
MRLTRSLTALAALAFALVAALVLTTGPAQAAGPAYVALGDSYSAGNGAGNYISSSGDCHRSNSAYPALWAGAHSPSSFTFAACSGAVTSDVTGSQLGGLNSSTGLVTLTIGGNDAGFSDVMTTCVTGSDSTCVNRVNQAETFVRNTLPGRLDTVYNAIRAKAPNARVVVLGYPDMYDLSAWFCVGLSDTKHQKINEAADVLDTTTASVAASHGFAFGDVRPTFHGHELCSGDDYLHSLVISPSWESYHPTATGHSAGYLPVLNAND